MFVFIVQTAKNSWTWRLFEVKNVFNPGLFRDTHVLNPERFQGSPLSEGYFPSQNQESAWAPTPKCFLMLVSRMGHGRASR